MLAGVYCFPSHNFFVCSLPLTLVHTQPPPGLGSRGAGAAPAPRGGPGDFLEPGDERPAPPGLAPAAAGLPRHPPPDVGPHRVTVAFGPAVFGFVLNLCLL